MSPSSGLLSALLVCCSCVAVSCSLLDNVFGVIKEDLQAPYGNKKPWFCHSLDCPRYTVMEKYPNHIERRSYDAAVWASTNVSGMSYDKAIKTGFWRLFNYIQGDNLDDQKIEMTAPVTVRVVPGEGPFCEDHFVISFFVPFDFQDSPPSPKSSDVYIDRKPPSDFFVVSYGGFSNEQKLLDHASNLYDALEDAGLKSDGGYFFSAGYDSPFRLIGRHNEVWVPAL